MSALRFQSSAFLVILLAWSGSVPHAVAADEGVTVRGSVTLDRKPLAGGRILFHQEDGQFIGAKIDKDGLFKIDRVLVGKYRITLDSKGVPDKYASDELTPLRLEVGIGPNEFVIQVVSK